VIWVNVIVSGVLLGGFYALFACGLSLMFGVMKIINLAHGDMAVVAGYTAVFLVPKFHLPEVWSFLIVVPVFALLGYVVQRTLFQKSIERDPFTTLLVTFGLSVVIENLLLEIYTANAQSINIGSLIAKSWQVNQTIYVSYLSLTVLIVSVVVLGALQLFLSRTSTGRQIRAVSDDREAAMLCGTNYRHIFGIASSLAFATVALAGIAYGMYSSNSPDRGRGEPALRLRDRRHRWHRLAVGHARRGHAVGHRPTVRRALQRAVPAPGGQHLVPHRVGDPSSGPLRQEGGDVVSVDDLTPSNKRSRSNATRSRSPTRSPARSHWSSSSRGRRGSCRPRG
jgi:branched-chain amino acid transport system permease protein